jgi:hypothetical protein
MINTSLKIRIEENGAKRLIRQLKKDYTVRVGWVGPKCLEIHNNSTETVEDDMVLHEFGGIGEDFFGNLFDVPRRSVIADYFDQNLSSITNEIFGIVSVVIDGRSTMMSLLKKFGKFHVKGMRNRIKSRISPPLSQMTLDRREVRGNTSDIPLLDTGQASAALEYDVEKR